jgi:hypothetical protein
MVVTPKLRYVPGAGAVSGRRRRSLQGAVLDEREQVGVESLVVAGVQAVSGTLVDGESGAVDEGSGFPAGEFQGRGCVLIALHDPGPGRSRAARSCQSPYLMATAPARPRGLAMPRWTIYGRAETRTSAGSGVARSPGQSDAERGWRQPPRYNLNSHRKRWQEHT